MSPTIALLIIGLVIGYSLGYLVHHWLYLKERAALANDWLDVAHYHQTHADRLQLDDTRLGINTGIGFAVHEMEDTMDELKERYE